MTTIRAAGGIPWRQGSDAIEVVVVHRPKYDDWTLPKGKLEPGEDERAAALREVEEETGLVCALGEEVGVTAYVDSKGREKTVRYFAMRPIGGALRPAHEVDEASWLALADAVSRLTYERDRALLERLTTLVGS